jgi:hypothetical protein
MEPREVRIEVDDDVMDDFHAGSSIIDSAMMAKPDLHLPR